MLIRKSLTLFKYRIFFVVVGLLCIQKSFTIRKHRHTMATHTISRWTTPRPSGATKPDYWLTGTSRSERCWTTADRRSPNGLSEVVWMLVTMRSIGMLSEVSERRWPLFMIAQWRIRCAMLRMVSCTIRCHGWPGDWGSWESVRVIGWWSICRWFRKRLWPCWRLCDWALCIQ